MTVPPVWVQVLGNFEVYAGTVFCLGIALLYAITARFWESPAGLVTMGLATSLGLLLLNVASFRWFGDYPGRVYVGLGLFSVLVVVLGALLVLLWRAQVWPNLRLWLKARRRKEVT